MPPVTDRACPPRREDILAGLRRILSAEAIIDSIESMHVFETDALTLRRQLPLVVVLPDSVAEVSAVLRFCHEHSIKVVARGAGTSLSGGALPLADGVLLVLSRFTRVLEIDLLNRTATVECGVTNLAITHAVEHLGLFYAPDPSSQIACTIGGNVAENSGGVHCLKYGLTTNNLLGVEFVLIDGTVITLGGKCLDSPGYDLLGIVVGSEGMLGIVTKVTVRLLPRPESAQGLLAGFDSVMAAADAVAAIISAGIVPAGLEMMDRPAIRAAEAFAHCGYPAEAEALLLIEIDGPASEVEDSTCRVEELLRERGASSLCRSRSESERAAMWAGRKAAFPAVGRLSPDYLCMDGTIPRREIGRLLVRIKELEREFGLRVANVFHAGDGNLHPLIMFDATHADEAARAEAFGAAILKECVDAGGVLSGEHGIGVEKKDLMPYQFTPIELDLQQRVKCAFDMHGLLNPGKMFPILHRCAELGRLHVHHGKLPFEHLPRF